MAWKRVQQEAACRVVLVASGPVAGRNALLIKVKVFPLLLQC
jgi:hypothetical protein